MSPNFMGMKTPGHVDSPWLSPEEGKYGKQPFCVLLTEMNR